MSSIKASNSMRPSLNRFELIGDDENALSKSFAYILSLNSIFLKLFLSEIDISYSISDFFYTEIEIQITSDKDCGVTDVEIITPKHYVIIECKVGDATVSKKQQVKYIRRFEKQKQKECVFCMITGTRNNFACAPRGDFYRVENLTWHDVLSLMITKFEPRANKADKQCLIDFENFLTKGDYMRTQNEILIQDLGPEKKELFEKYHIYNQADIKLVFPLYFAPYYSKRNETPGINWIASVRYARRCTKQEMIQKLDELEDKGSSNYKLWKKGLENFHEKGIRCFYLLDEPIKIYKPLKKVSNPKDGADWVSLRISPNRCVSFADFLKHSALYMEEDE